MARRKTTRSPSPPPLPAPPREPERPSPFQYIYPCSPFMVGVRQLVEGLSQGRFRVPLFQRGLVWQDRDVLALLDSLLAGYYTGAILLWEQRKLSPEVPCVYRGVAPSGHDQFLVVDGQQRLHALASAFLGKRFGYDFEQKKFCVDQPESATCVLLWRLYGNVDGTGRFKAHDAWCRQHGSDGQDVAHLTDALLWRQIVTIRIPADNTLPEVIEMFRRLNTTGVPMDLTELEVALARAIAV